MIYVLQEICTFYDTPGKKARIVMISRDEQRVEDAKRQLEIKEAVYQKEREEYLTKLNEIKLLYNKYIKKPKFKNISVGREKELRNDFFKKYNVDYFGFFIKYPDRRCRYEIYSGEEQSNGDYVNTYLIENNEIYKINE